MVFPGFVSRLPAGLLTALLLAGTHAIAANDARILTLDDAIVIALERNTALRQARNNQAISEVGVREAWMRFVPTFDVSATGGNFYDDHEDDTRSIGIGATSNLVLFDGFRDVTALRIARLGEQSSGLNLQRLQETTVLTVVSQFLALTQSLRQLTVQQQNLATALELQRQIEIYVETGDRARADLYTQQSAVASARLSVLDAERGIQLARLELLNTLQLERNAHYEFEAPEEEGPALLQADSTTDSDVELDTLIVRALARRTDFQAQHAQVEAAEKGIRLSRPSRWPTVSLSAGYGSAYIGSSPLDFRDQLDLNRGSSVALNFTVPLFRFDSTRLAVRRAELQLDNARIALAQTRDDIELQVRRAWLDYNSARERYKVVEIQQQTAQLALETTQERYQIGAATLVELSQARASFLQSESALVNARYNLIFQRTALKYFVGDLDIP